ncbi:MAG: SH3 domain-containing protein [Terriglobales bacterium]
MKTSLYRSLQSNFFFNASVRLQRAGGASLLALTLLAGCGGQDEAKAEYGYITAPSIALRDRVAAVYNKVAIMNNGDPVRIVERHGNKRFVKVRSDEGKEGWIPQRYLAPQEIFDQFARLAQQNAANVSQAGAVTRRIVNMHVTPARESPVLYQLKEGERLQLLKRASAPRVAPRPAPKAVEPEEEKVDPAKAGENRVEDKEGDDEPVKAPPPAAAKVKGKAAQVVAVPGVPATGVPMEDWWLVRDSRQRVGWILGRMMDVDIPLEVAQYAEGKRIVASHVLNEVPERGGARDKLVAQYLVLLTENKDGMPFDFNQARVFTWNQRHGRYETAYRERLTGELPFKAGTEAGVPYFVLRATDADGRVAERKYRMTGVMVRRVTEAAPGTKPDKPPTKAPSVAKPQTKPQTKPFPEDIPKNLYLGKANQPKQRQQPGFGLNQKSHG